MLKKIKIEEAQDGMVLATNVEDRMGRPILKEGDVMKATFIPRMKQWGIDEVTILVPGEEGVEEASEVDPQEVDALLNTKFQFFDETSHMNVVKKIARKYLLMGKSNF